WHGLRIWSSTSPESSRLLRSARWPPSGARCSPRPTPCTTRSCTVSAIRSTALLCTRSSRLYRARMHQLTMDSRLHRERRKPRKKRPKDLVVV
uniref:Uncharacterized protein n=1 Tax=Anopheles minimus TaxID=112268 RepID=A0A903Z020_9DIPT